MKDIKYLWIDTLCINQFDKKEKKNFINNIGYIYYNSKITFAFLENFKLNDNLKNSEEYINSFCSDKQWNSIWTLKECIISNEIVFIDLFKKKPFTFDNIMKESLKFKNNKKIKLINETWNLRKYRNKNDKLSLTYIIYIASNRIVHDDQDKVYAINGIMRF